MTDWQWVTARFALFGAIPYMHFREKSYHYAGLIIKVANWQRELSRLGVTPGQTVSLTGEYSPNLVALTLALILNRNILVPLSRQSQSLQGLDSCLSLASASGGFEFDETDSWQYRRFSHEGKHPLYDQLRAEDEAGMVIFTSGSSGTPKGALHQVSKLVQRHRTKRRKGYRTLVFLTPDHIGGINTIIAILMNGGTVITSRDRSPRGILSSIERHRVELLPTTPTFLNMLLMSNLLHEYDVSSLKLITYGTEPMSDRTLQGVVRALPDVTLKQTFGMTELGIFPTRSLSTGSTWLKVGGSGVETKIVDGILWLKTDTAMLGYLNAPSPFDENGWYNTRDRVEVDGDYLRILGRDVEMISVGGEKVHPAEIESVLLEIPNIRDVLVSGKSSPVTGQIVTARVQLVEPEPEKQVRRRVFEYCRSRLPRYRIPVIVTVSEDGFVSNRFKKLRQGEH